jgi:voltage-gated potassium channel
MAVDMSVREKRSNAYQLFILVLTIFALLIMVALLLPLTPATRALLTFYDNLICVIFLFDFFVNLKQSHPRRDYFIGRRGWLDLIGSIPTLGFFKYTALLRLARISRLLRIMRLLRGKNRREMVRDVVQHRGQYAVFVTILAALIVLSVSSALVLQFESKASDANITTGGGAMWWSVVTITTVGYGDEYPVTLPGRITAVFVMFTGVGIIGALASILASVLVPQGNDDEEPVGAGAPSMLEQELAQMRQELSALRELIAADRGDPPRH